MDDGYADARAVRTAAEAPAVRPAIVLGRPRARPAFFVVDAGLWQGPAQEPAGRHANARVCDTA